MLGRYLSCKHGNDACSAVHVDSLQPFTGPLPEMRDRPICVICGICGLMDLWIGGVVIGGFAAMPSGAVRHCISPHSVPPLVTR